jgi:uncharacterized protein YutE (UPF0331/DUF86 family)
MVNNDIVFEKIKNIQNCLKRIQEKTKGEPQSLHDADSQDIFVLNLQRAIQSTIDLAAHVVADEGLGLPSDLKENFFLLEKAKIIPADLSTRLQKMVGFRNIAVHEYTAIDVTILESILTKDLPDLEKCYVTILKHFQLSTSD